MKAIFAIQFSDISHQSSFSINNKLNTPLVWTTVKSHLSENCFIYMYLSSSSAFLLISSSNSLCLSRSAASSASLRNLSSSSLLSLSFSSFSFCCASIQGPSSGEHVTSKEQNFFMASCGCMVPRLSQALLI